ncbi:MAG: hypothetical protein L6Q76_38640, partial [Polyangiaceae bacterium]|nr:hypothetical protein [Polyangiaceae bacterium]
PSAAALGACDAAFWNILERGLAKDISARWPTIKALATALAMWACERGVEEDITGAPIARQWLAEKGRRLLTVLPQGDPSAPSPAARLDVAPAQAPPPLHQAPPPMLAPPRSAPGMAQPPRSAPLMAQPAPYSAPSMSDDLPWKPSLARRLLVPIVLMLLLAGGVLAAVVSSDTEEPSSEPISPPASAAVATPPVIPLPAAPAAEPSPEPSSAPSSADSEEAAAATAKPVPTAKPRPKPAAPKVPKHINF